MKTPEKIGVFSYVHDYNPVVFDMLVAGGGAVGAKPECDLF